MSSDSSYGFSEAIHPSIAYLELYLDGHLKERERSLTRGHLDVCPECWREWNSLRWRRAEGTRDLNELRGFLGNRMLEGVDSSWRLAEEWKQVDRTSPSEIEKFYATTPWYVFNSTIWAASGQRPKYVERASNIIASVAPNRIVDFGCGVGTDGLVFSQEGREVIFVDINESALDFVRWRLKVRNLPGTVCTPNAAKRWLPADLLWAMDVVEHLVDPIATLAPLLHGCSTLIFDSEHVGTSNGRHPFHFQHDEKQIASDLRDLGFKRLNWPDVFNLWTRI
jgi:Methyltransferase small domain